MIKRVLNHADIEANLMFAHTISDMFDIVTEAMHSLGISGERISPMIKKEFPKVDWVCGPMTDELVKHIMSFLMFLDGERRTPEYRSSFEEDRVRELRMARSNRQVLDILVPFMLSLKIDTGDIDPMLSTEFAGVEWHLSSTLADGLIDHAISYMTYLDAKKKMIDRDKSLKGEIADWFPGTEVYGYQNIGGDMFIKFTGIIVGGNDIQASVKCVNDHRRYHFVSTKNKNVFFSPIDRDEAVLEDLTCRTQVAFSDWYVENEMNYLELLAKAGYRLIDYRRDIEKKKPDMIVTGDIKTKISGGVFPRGPYP